MFRIALVGAEGSLARQAARRFAPDAAILSCTDAASLLTRFAAGEADFALFPVYNTREGEQKQPFRMLDRIPAGAFWVDNVVLHSQISLGVFSADTSLDEVRTVVGDRDTLSQCAEYIDAHFPQARTVSVADIEGELRGLEGCRGVAAADHEDRLRSFGMTILEREIAPYNRTRFAVFGHEPAPASGYDASVYITGPLDDRVGLLVDMLGEFSRRGVSLLDLRTENDVKTQKLRIYLEVEGHAAAPNIAEAVTAIETRVIRRKSGERGAMRLLGSFPRVDMRAKRIKTFGFIGTGPMSRWFAERLEGEGYAALLSGRTTELRPEDMIARADVVVVCVPISATPETVSRYAPLVAPGKALILLAGEAEKTLDAALAASDPGVEVMLVHNLWGPRAATMRDKNAIVVRTPRSGPLCSEFESFLYKHGAEIVHDSPRKHDLLMGVGQRLPTIISVALAMSLSDNGVTARDLAGHCTLTSLYPILAMARVHAQNPRTYAEIMATSGDSGKIALDFAKNLDQVLRRAEAADLEALVARIEANARDLDADFLATCMRQARAVDEVLSRTV